MTTPSITTGSFQGTLWPQDLVQQVLNLLVGGAPFSDNALTRYPTSRHEVAFPTASPDRPAWVAEMAPIPVVNLNDDADIVGVCKLASIVLTSNESVSDTDVNLTQQFGDLLRDSASAELDRGLLYGTGSAANEPDGVVAAAPSPPAAADFGGAVAAAIGEIGDAGGTATHLCARPSTLAGARDISEATGSSPLAYPQGIGAAYGLTEVPVPELQAGDGLVIDKSRCYLVLRSDFLVDSSTDAFYQQDALAIRLRGRFAVAVPQLDKGIRKLNVTGGLPGPGRAQAERRSSKGARPGARA
jgi:HK97 family phage major capsid protein